MLPAERTRAESSARRQHIFRGEIAASSERTSSERLMSLQGKEAARVLGAERTERAEARCRDHAVARNDEREAVARTERAGRALRIRMSRQRSQLSVRDALAVRNLPQRLRNRSLERRRPREIELDVREVDPLPVEVPLQRPRERVRIAPSGRTRPRKLVVNEPIAVHPDLPYAPAVGLVRHDLHVLRMPVVSSAPGIFRPPPPVNEPVRSYAPGSPERESLKKRLEEMRSERIEIPCVIGGKDVKTGTLREAVMPHDKDHVLADVHQCGATEVEQAIKAAADAWNDWHRVPWEERAAVFLRAAELLAGPWRDTLNAATMLGQSKTAHQAEIDAACELIDFWRFNPAFMTRMYEEQPHSSPGVWNRMEYRPLEGFVFAVSPFNFAASGGNLAGAPALMGNAVLWKPASTGMLSAYYTMRIFQEAGLPDGVINLVYGSGKDIGDAALASPDLAGVHFTGSTAVFQGMWRTIGANIENYRSYPRIVGETGGKDFIVAHPTADAEAVATAILRGSFEYQGQKCSAASRVYAPESMWPELQERLVEQVRTIKVGDVSDFSNFMGAVIDASAFATQ